MLSCKKVLFAVSLLLALISTAIAKNVLVKQNFDTGFTQGILKTPGKFPGGDYIIMDDSGSIEIVGDAKSVPNALRISRKGVVGFTSIRSIKTVPYGNDFRVSFDVKVAKQNNVTVFIGNQIKI